MAEQLNLGDLIYRLGFANEAEFEAALNGLFAKSERQANAAGQKTSSEFQKGFKYNFGAWAAGSFVGNVMAQAFSGAVSAAKQFATDSVKEFATYQQGLVQLKLAGAQNLGAIEKQLEQISEASKVFSKTDVSLAVGKLVKAGYSAQQALELVSKSTYTASSNIDEATGKFDDLGDTAVSIGNIMRGLQIPFSQAGHVTDVLAKAAQDSSLDMSGLIDIISQVGPFAKDAGVSIEQLAGTAAVLSNNGLQADKIGRGLRSVLNSLINPPKNVQKQFDALGISLIDSNGNARDLGTVLQNLNKVVSQGPRGVQILGTGFNNFGIAVATAAGNSAKTINAMSDSMDHADGEAQKLSDTLQNSVYGQMQQLQAETANAKEELGEKLAPVMLELYQDVLPALVTSLTAVVNVFEDLEYWIGGSTAALQKFEDEQDRAVQSHFGSTEQAQALASAMDVWQELETKLSDAQQTLATDMKKPQWFPGVAAMVKRDKEAVADLQNQVNKAYQNVLTLGKAAKAAEGKADKATGGKPAPKTGAIPDDVLKKARGLVQALEDARKKGAAAYAVAQAALDKFRQASAENARAVEAIQATMSATAGGDAGNGTPTSTPPPKDAIVQWAKKQGDALKTLEQKRQLELISQKDYIAAVQKLDAGLANEYKYVQDQLAKGLVSPEKAKEREDAILGVWSGVDSKLQDLQKQAADTTQAVQGQITVDQQWAEAQQRGLKASGDEIQKQAGVFAKWNADEDDARAKALEDQITLRQQLRDATLSTQDRQHVAEVATQEHQRVMTDWLNRTLAAPFKVATKAVTDFWKRATKAAKDNADLQAKIDADQADRLEAALQARKTLREQVGTVSLSVGDAQHIKDVRDEMARERANPAGQRSLTSLAEQQHPELSTVPSPAERLAIAEVASAEWRTRAINLLRQAVPVEEGQAVGKILKEYYDDLSQTTEKFSQQQQEQDYVAGEKADAQRQEVRDLHTAHGNFLKRQAAQQRAVDESTKAAASRPLGVGPAFASDNAAYQAQITAQQNAAIELHRQLREISPETERFVGETLTGQARAQRLSIAEGVGSLRQAGNALIALGKGIFGSWVKDAQSAQAALQTAQQRQAAQLTDTGTFAPPVQATYATGPNIMLASGITVGNRELLSGSAGMPSPLMMGYFQWEGAQRAKDKQAADEQRKNIQQAAEDFRKTVVSAGVSFADSIIQGIQSGNPGEVAEGALGAGASIISAAGLPIIGAGVGIFGELLGAILGPAPKTAAQQRAEQQSRAANTPSIEYNVSTTINVSVPPLTDPAARAQVEEIAKKVTDDNLARLGYKGNKGNK